MTAAAASVMLGMSLGQAIGSLTQGVFEAQSISRQAEYNAKTYELNRQLADMMAEDALRRGSIQVDQHRKGIKQLIGQQRVALAAQNIQLDEGSAIEVMQSTAMVGEMEALTISNNAWKEAFGYKVSALNALSQAGATRAEGSIKAQSSLITGGLNAFGTAAQGYYRYQS